jgi:hypothetical protein
LTRGFIKGESFFSVRLVYPELFSPLFFPLTLQTALPILQDVVDLLDERDEFFGILLDGCLLTQLAKATSTM